MDDKQDDKMSRSRTIRRSMKEAFGLKKTKTPLRTIDSRLSEYFRDHDNAACKVSDSKIAKVRQRIQATETTDFKDADIALALVSDYSDGDADKALDLLETLESAEAGLLEPYSADVKLVGAVNRNAVTCWLDSVLFAMFAHSDDFEPMLFYNFEDPSRRRLAVLIRMWVNMLRTGKLITASITQQIQETLADCGWREAASRQQQDASEAFGRLTEFLDLPPLTLKRDMFHQGKADQDDHKFTHERTIDIGIPPAREDGQAIRLEECLESYFDETVNVNRQKEEYARRYTLGAGSTKTGDADADLKNSKALHIEVAEVGSSSPTAMTPTTPVPPYLEGRPQLMEMGRAPSIFSEKQIEAGERPLSPTRQNSLPVPPRKRSTTVGKQVQMRAFQFFRLIPWYTEGNPNTDLQVAQHFESKRPAVGICLKRFVAVDDAGTKWTKRKDFVDIPIESGIPSFLHDDDLKDEVFPNWKFKLSLQSVICHRGDSLERGHYISIVRVEKPKGLAPMQGADKIPQEADPWVLHDDLAKSSRVRYVDIEHALKQEVPYLLFYKIVLIEGEIKPGRVSFDGRPPSYSSADSETQPSTTVSTAISLSGSARPSQVGDNITLSTAPSLMRAKSEASSVISNTSGPPLPVQVRTETDVTQASWNDPDLQVNGFEARTQSAPAEVNPAQIAEVLKADRQEVVSTEKPGTSSRSRPSSSSNSGSLARLSQMLRPAPSTRNSKEKLEIDPKGRRSVEIADAAVHPRSTQHTSGKADTGGEANTHASRGFRKSMDEIRSARKKEKEKGHRRDRSLGDRLKAKRGDDPDRECSVM